MAPIASHVTRFEEQIHRVHTPTTADLGFDPPGIRPTKKDILSPRQKDHHRLNEILIWLEAHKTELRTCQFLC
jgi:hypothetical protein